MPRFSLTSKKFRAVVAGDAVTDWVIARPDTTTQKKGARAKGQHSPTTPVRGEEIHAGARLVEDLLGEVQTKRFEVAPQNWRSAWDDELFTRMSHVYATLREYPSSAEAPSNTTAWRMDDYMGLIQRPPTCGEHEDIPSDKNKDASLAVLVDMGIDFSSSESHWPSAITDERRTPWIILKWDNQKIDQEIKHGALWQKLANRKNRLVVVTTADNLRHNKGIEISRGLSWERTAGDCAAALMSSNSPLHELTGCAYVVISFGPVGALVLDHQADNDFTLLFDPQKLESSSDFWRNGRMWGYTSALTAAIARTFMQHCSQPADRPQVTKGVRAGLNAMRSIYNTGFVEHRGPNGTTIQFPVAETAAAIMKEEGPVHFAEASFKASSSLHDFNILREKYNQFNTELLALSRSVAVKGPAALTEAPRRTYGVLTTVDRDEIESFESIRDIVSGYAEKEKKQRAPISIAMFGAPGSGKSTAVEEVIGSLDIGMEFDPLTFNLSQFRSPNELDEAFHLIRDARLSGKLPLVFWDEFDTYFERSLGWLRYFLSPMQDGSFREGQVIHPIGKSIFVFAGGVSHSLAHFRTQPDFVQAKAPDFLSRVHGVIDLKGIDASSGDTGMGSYYMIRRAIILNSILRNETDLFKGVDGTILRDPSAIMDSGVLDAFLTVPKYRNGVRSMKAIVSTSSLAGETHFGRSNLPARNQLNLHVDADEFYARMRS